MPARKITFAIAAIVATALTLAAVAVADQRSVARSAGNLTPFVGKWGGHTRQLTVSSSGVARELLDSGCCDKVARVTYRLSHARGSGNVVSASARITKARILDASAFGDGKYALRRPRVGQHTRFRLNRSTGVLTIMLNKITYCNEEAGNAGACGA